jgi:Transglycosylase SLT domain
MGNFRIGFWLVLLAILPRIAVAQTSSPAEVASDPTCSTIEATARANRLPIDFLVRLIWRESRFSADAIGPVTRSGERAQGIAQFMPGTAADRHLIEPFNPLEAIPKSAEFLAELRAKFGNLGLAAAAYNAGARQVSEYVAGSQDLPLETRQYVLAVTGRPIEDWTRLGKLGSNTEQLLGQAPAVTCHEVLGFLKQASKSQLQQRAVPSWCAHLRHPNTNVCGTVREPDLPKPPKPSSFANLRASGPSGE